MNSTVPISGTESHSSSESDSSDDGSSSGSNESNEDAVSKLLDDKAKLSDKIRILQEETKNLKSQYAIVWAERKTKVASLEKQLEEMKEELRIEKDKNFCLQEALVSASKARSGWLNTCHLITSGLSRFKIICPHVKIQFYST